MTRPGETLAASIYRSVMPKQSGCTASTGETGSGRIRYRVYTQLETDADYLGRILERAIDGAHLAEYTHKGTESYFVLDFPKEYEDKFERLLSFSSSVKSYHLQQQKENKQ